MRVEIERERERERDRERGIEIESRERTIVIFGASFGHQNCAQFRTIIWEELSRLDLCFR